jgi:peptide/nickel transport system permease protein
MPMTETSALTLDDAAPTIGRAAPRFRRLRVFLRNPSAVGGAVVLILIACAALAAPWIYPGDPLSIVGRPLQWPGQNVRFLLGTDALGHDVAAGILHGARMSLSVGLAATALCLTVGIVVGAIAGYAGGRIDDLLVRIIEIFQSVPHFVLLVVVIAVIEPSAPTITFAIALILWPTIARLTRAEFRSIREKEFVMAARSLGCGPVRIIFREILPNALPPIVVTASVMVASAILLESSLAFMGLGDPNVVSWGSMIGSGREQIRSAWYLTALPGLAIVFTVLALNLVGDGLNEALDPRNDEAG